MTRNLEEEMNRRIESGEFGNPPNIKLVTAVMQEMHEMEVTKLRETLEKVEAARHASAELALAEQEALEESRMNCEMSLERMEAATEKKVEKFTREVALISNKLEKIRELNERMCL